MTQISVIRRRIAVVAFGLLAAALNAQEQQPVDDPIANELSAAKETNRASTNKASDGVLEVFAKEIKKLEGKSRLKVAEQIKQIEQLKAEMKSFQTSKLLPSSPVMKDAVDKYRTATKAANTRFEKAFDVAAEKYRRKKNLAAAKAILDAKQEFVLDVSPFLFEGVWLSTHANRWSGRRTVNGDGVIDFDGTSCRWQRKGAQITVTWPHGGWEKLEIDFKNPDQLKGKTERGLNCTWVRRK